MSGKGIVLDAWAVMAFLEDEPAGVKVAEILAGASESDAPIWISVVNLGEVFYILTREIDEPQAERSIAKLLDLGIRVQDADWALTRMAAKLKAHYRMSYADCFAAALAQQKDATLITGDEEFRQVTSLVSIIFVHEST